MKIKEDEAYYYLICLGCNQEHLIPKWPSENGSTWSFNGNFEKPTFTPSVKITWPEWINENDKKMHCCHFNITDGMIQYHPDCTHDLRGSMELPEIPDKFASN